MSDKSTATRVIFYNPVTNSIIGAHPTGRKFKGKDGSPATGTWSLPGGIVDPGEDLKTCAVREIKEECDIDISKSKLKYLGHYSYIENKDLEMFLYEVDDSFNAKSLKCKSYFEAPDGRMLPENNAYQFMNLESDMKMFFGCLQKVLKQLLVDHKNIFYPQDNL